MRAADLTVVRGGRTVLRGLDFTVPRGRITGLLGPSGCGKSTLMRAVVGTQARTTGILEVLGEPAGSVSLRSRIGYLTQAPSVYRDLTVRQNLDYFAAVLDPGSAATDRRRAAVARAIADVDLAGYADQLAGTLSGGQLGRVSLAVALLGAPQLLVLDEPTVGLDPVLRRDLWDLFHSLAAERGTTLLVSSHVMDEAERCHRLLLMRDGEFLGTGASGPQADGDTPEALRAATGTATVEAAFLHLVDRAAGRTDPADACDRFRTTRQGVHPMNADPHSEHPTATAVPTTPPTPRAGFSLWRTTATAARVLRQLRHDPRSLALLLLVPCVMLVLLRYVFDGQEIGFDAIGAALLGIFPLITMFLVTSIATLRERTSGTLERLLTMPLGRSDLIGGYALAFGGLAVVQSALATGVAVWGLGLDVTGSPWLLLLIALLDALLGTALGLFVSAFASSEFQAVQFMPAVIFPQILLCGLLAPRSSMHPVLEAISDVLPMSYAVEAMDEVVRHSDVTGTFVRDVVVVAGCALLVLVLGAATLRRRTP